MTTKVSLRKQAGDSATPSASDDIVRAATKPVSVTDDMGRVLTVRRLNALDKLRLFKAAGPTTANNQPYMGMVMTAAMVSHIDGEPVTPLITERHIEALVSQLGDDGLEAVAGVLEEVTGISIEDIQLSAKN